MKSFIAYKTLICSIQWFRSSKDICNCYQNLHLNYSSDIKPKELINLYYPGNVSLCKIEPIDVILVYLLYILNKFHTSF